MRAGEVVEAGETATLFRSPRHSYTRTLLDSIPTLKKRRAASA
jgi:oligopeptide/dipeptide ABC transporter ATP-binding protein